MGPAVCKLLHNVYADRVGCQGVGGSYRASISDNMLPKGTSESAINEAIKMFTTAVEKCPNAIVTFGGFRYVKYPNKSIRSRWDAEHLTGDLVKAQP